MPVRLHLLKLTAFSILLPRTTGNYQQALLKLNYYAN